MRARALLAGLCALALVAAAPASAQAPRPKPRPVIVTVNDFYFAPTSVTIRKGRAVRWVWSEGNTYPHDVHLKKGPRRLKRRASYSTRTTAVTDAHFQRVFERPGTYRFICTVHPTQMRMTIVVRK